MEERPYCTGLDTTVRERYKQKNAMLRDPHFIKRSDSCYKEEKS